MSEPVDLAGLRATVRRLADSDAIMELQHRFALAIDLSDLDRLRDVLTTDAVVEGWTDAALEGIDEVIRRLREINAGHQASHRMITNPRIALGDAHARASVHYRSAHIDEAAPDGGATYRPSHSHEGWYLSELRRTSAGWRIARLKHVSLQNADVTSVEGRRQIAELAGFVEAGALDREGAS